MSDKKKILVINGPNLNLLGLREPEIYGKQDYTALEQLLKDTAQRLHVEMDMMQSNHEGVLVDTIQQAWGVYDGIVINPAAYTHTSVAILDALKAVGIPAVEVHLSDISQRESFRQFSYVSLAACKTVSGKGFAGYVEAMEYLMSIL